MWQNVYMLFDNVSQMFIGSLAILINDAVAMRTFKEYVLNDKSPYYVMAADIKLFKIGTFHTVLGDFKPDKQFVCNLIDLVDELKKGKVKNET